jgi:hypothetical protein
MAMVVTPLLGHILRNDSLTRGLGDAEARMLVEWLVDQAEFRAQGGAPETAALAEVMRMCRRARGIGRFVSLWCHAGERGAAVQLAAAERFTWPLPTRSVDPCELMQDILTWEAKGFAA